MTQKNPSIKVYTVGTPPPGFEDILPSITLFTAVLRIAEKIALTRAAQKVHEDFQIPVHAGSVVFRAVNFAITITAEGRDKGGRAILRALETHLVGLRDGKMGEVTITSVDWVREGPKVHVRLVRTEADQRTI